MDFYKILIEIMEEQNISVAEVARRCGLTDSTVRSIIDRKQCKVALSVAFKLSDGLGVSLERLNGTEEKSSSPSLEAMEIAKQYDTLSDRDKAVVRALFNAFAENIE